MRSSPLDNRETRIPNDSPPVGERSSATLRHRWPLLILAGAFCAGVLLFVGGNWIVMPLVTRGRVVRVPDLYGLDVAVAKRTLLDGGLAFVSDSTDYLWDDDVPANNVVTQIPPPYSPVKRGRRVRVTTSRGPQLYPVPDVHNMSPTQAKLRLQQQFFGLGTVRYTLRTDEDRSESFVRDQTPRPGSALPRGAKVNLDVSILPQMPDLTGRGVEEARRYIELLGLRVGSVRYEQSDDLLPWSVLGQSIPPRRRIRAGDTVDLVLSHL